jgi:hypothetical protein
LSLNEEEIEKWVFLLAIYKKMPDESLMDVTKSLANTGMFDLKRGKEILKELKREQYIINDQLTIKGIAVAIEAEDEFKL